MTEMARAGGELKGKSEDYQGGEMARSGKDNQKNAQKRRRRRHGCVAALQTHIQSMRNMSAIDMYCHYHFLLLQVGFQEECP